MNYYEKVNHLIKFKVFCRNHKNSHGMQDDKTWKMCVFGFFAVVSCHFFC